MYNYRNIWKNAKMKSFISQKGEGFNKNIYNSDITESGILSISVVFSDFKSFTISF